MNKINIIHNLSNNNPAAQLLETLVEVLGDRADCSMHYYALKPGIWCKIKHFLTPNFRIWRDTYRAQTLLIHTSVVFSLTQVLIAKLTGTKVVIIFWDIYPRSALFFGKHKNTVLVRLYQNLEERILQAADLVLLPSQDYVAHAQSIGLEQYEIFPLWPFLPKRAPITKRKDPTRLHIGYAGMLNDIRGIPDAVQMLGACYSGDITLHIFSPERLKLGAQKVPDNIEIAEHGYVDQNLLVTELMQLDAGLVCLHPQFDLPAFPSKIISYITSGLPVIYSGPKSTAIREYLEKNKVGICLSPTKSVDLGKELIGLKANFTESQTCALASLELTKERLDKIL